jgi:hypothetical protein
VHRRFPDWVVSLILNVHRYRCTNLGCGWEGVVSKPRFSGFPASAWATRGAWMLAGAVLSVGLLEGGHYLLDRRHGGSRPAKAVPALVLPAIPPGESFDGFELPAGDPRQLPELASLDFRHSCAWGVPGRKPYKGTLAQVLTGAKLPRKVVDNIERMVERRQVSDRLEISNEGIRSVSGRRSFDTRLVAMGFGNTLCFDTKVHFKPGHVEMADLYEGTDDSGTGYAVMIPYVCGNVSVLAERAEKPSNGDGYAIPEPSTWTALLAGLAAMAWVLRPPRPSPPPAPRAVRRARCPSEPSEHGR